MLRVSGVVVALLVWLFSFGVFVLLWFVCLIVICLVCFLLIVLITVLLVTLCCLWLAWRGVGFGCFDCVRGCVFVWRLRLFVACLFVGHFMFVFACFAGGLLRCCLCLLVFGLLCYCSLVVWISFNSVDIICFFCACGFKLLFVVLGFAF